MLASSTESLDARAPRARVTNLASDTAVSIVISCSRAGRVDQRARSPPSASEPGEASQTGARPRRPAAPPGSSTGDSARRVAGLRSLPGSARHHRCVLAAYPAAAARRPRPRARQGSPLDRGPDRADKPVDVHHHGPGRRAQHRSADQPVDADPVEPAEPHHLHHGDAEEDQAAARRGPASARRPAPRSRTPPCRSATATATAAARCGTTVGSRSAAGEPLPGDLGRGQARRRGRTGVTLPVHADLPCWNSPSRSNVPSRDVGATFGRSQQVLEVYVVGGR